MKRRENIYNGNLDDLVKGIEDIKKDTENSGEIIISLVKQIKIDIEGLINYDDVDEKTLNDIHDYLDNIEIEIDFIKGGLNNE